MEHSSKQIANELIKLAAAEGKTLTVMQLLKLVYIAHGWMLGLYGRPLISDRIEAWKYGPVIPELYQAIKGYGGNPVPQVDCVNRHGLDLKEQDLLQQVMGKYGHLTGPQLSNLTHKAGTPWSQVYSDDCYGTVIVNDAIKSHYQGLANARQ